MNLSAFFLLLLEGSRSPVSWTNEILGINIHYRRAVPKLGAVFYSCVCLDTCCPLFTGSQVVIKHNWFYCNPLHKKKMF